MANSNKGHRAHPVRRRKDTLLRRLALAKLRELRRMGLSYREIAERFALHPRTKAVGEPFRFRLPPERLLALDPLEGSLPFLRALDVLEQGLAFFTRSGELVHANRVFSAALRTSEESGKPLSAELEHFVVSLSGLVKLRHLAEEDTVEDLGTRQVPSLEGISKLRGSYIGLDLFGTGPAILITLEPPLPEPLSDEVLHCRFGLTAQERRIARLLVEGRSNREIAARLHISPHTARHHTEKVLGKVGATSRAKAMARLLDQGGVGS